MDARTHDLVNSPLAAWLKTDQKQERAVQECNEKPVVKVAISALSIGDSPRVCGANEEHVQALAATHAQLPPIIVHYPTMRVIDGIHRLHVATFRGDKHIAARFFYGDEADAFVLAVKANIAHGLPLTLIDRKAATLRIMLSHQHWSDRMISSVTGLSARTVADIRRRDAGRSAQVSARVGQDGRVRPINGAEGRILASQLIANDPDLPLRKVARAAGISAETARDVRNRLRMGEDPVPKRFRKKESSKNDRNQGRRIRPAGSRRPAHPSGDIVAIVRRLRADPAIRLTETGRILLRLLHVQLIETGKWEKIGDNIPPHCSDVIAGLARECAEMWRELANDLDRKAASMSTLPDKGDPKCGTYAVGQ